MEIILSRRFLQEPSNGRAVTYAVTANLASAILGFFLAEPVWTFMVVHFLQIERMILWNTQEISAPLFAGRR